MAVLVYRIYPAVGIARVGDSDQYYLAPEKLSELHENPTGHSQTPQAGRLYRDNTAAPGKLLRQAARFRIYEFTYKLETDTDPVQVKEVTSAEWDIRWTVELANKKSFPVGQSRSETNRIFDSPATGVLDPGATQPVLIDRALPGATPNKVNLATLRPDGQGRLIVVPGSGARGHIHPNEAAARGVLQPVSAGWWDDLGDGPVHAEIRPKNNTTAAFKPVIGAWMLLAAPAYGGPVRHTVTLYDVVFALHFSMLPTFPRGRTTFSFREDVHPLLHRGSLTSWVSNNAKMMHGPGAVADFTDAQRLVRLGTQNSDPNAVTERKKILDRVKTKQVGSQYGAMAMPPPGMQAATSFQLRAFEAWVTEPSFALDWSSQPPPTPAIDVPAEITRCYLSTATGGVFFPGMEVAAIARKAATWPLVAPPGMKTPGWDDTFRVDVSKSAGDLTASLPVPWQVDLFLNCLGSYVTNLLPFGAQPVWPGSRPLEVVDQSNASRKWGIKPGFGDVDPGDALDRWMEFGFLRKVVSSGGTVQYLDGERKPSLPYP